MQPLAAGLRVPRVDPRVVDVVLAAAAVTMGQIDVWLRVADGGDAENIISLHRPLAAALSFVGLSMLLLRRRAPLAGLVVMLATFTIQVQLVQPVALFFGQFVPVALMTYAVAAYSPKTPTAVTGLGVAVCGVVVVTRSVPSLRPWADVAFDCVIVAIAWALGRLVGTRGRRADALATRAELLERDREHTIAQERARLARELHDIVAHSVSVIAVQAEAGETLLDEPERAAEAFRSIQATSRQALVELRRLLGLLREVDGPPALAPQPGLAEVEQLVEQVRAAGLDVDLSVEGSPRRLDQGVALSAYRVVQEALTNSLKHAGPAHACVRVRYLPYAVELEISDDGKGANGATGSTGGGHGLVGMRERVALYGGEVSAGRDPRGGFAVRARLPLDRP